MAGTVSPSARAAKVSAMRCFRTGSASAATSSIEGDRRPSISARARQASIRAWAARGPGPQAISLVNGGILAGPGRADEVEDRLDDAVADRQRRTRRWMPARSSAVMAGLATASRSPVVSISTRFSAARSG